MFILLKWNGFKNSDRLWGITFTYTQTAETMVYISACANQRIHSDSFDSLYFSCFYMPMASLSLGPPSIIKI